MPRLLLLRHAKSSWAEPGMADRDRPLAPRGRRAAERMASRIAEPDLLPDRILCSPARRTRETLAALLPRLAGGIDIAIADDLYDSEEAEYREIICAHRGAADRLLVIGHNPDIQATAVALVGSADKRIAAELAAKFPTAALAVIDFDAETWAGLRAGSGRLVAFIRPRDLDGGDDPADED
jgi:phosphohistidine phosphatase